MTSRIKHIAFATEDCAKTAQFYKDAFGLTELFRIPADTGADGVWLSDGYIYFAIIKHGSDRGPNFGKGPTSVPGFHHIGFHIDDMAATCSALEANDAKSYPGMDGNPDRFRFYMGPDGMMIDLRTPGFGWDEAIKRKMQLYELTPAASPAKERST